MRRRRRRRISARAKLFGLVSLIAIGGMTSLVSGANFSKKTPNTSSAAAGAVTVNNSKGGTAIISASNMGPGDVRSGNLNLTNNGNVTSTVRLTMANLVNSPTSPALSDTLELKVEDITGSPTTLWNGKLTAFSSVDAGSLADGATRSYRLTLTWPAADKNPGLQAASSSLTFRWKVRS